MNCPLWTEKYSLHIAIIDEQHKKLLASIHKLCECVSKNLDNRTFIGKALNQGCNKEILDEMADYALAHFATEEKYFDEFHYEKADEHKAHHERFRKKIKALRRHFENGEDSVALEILVFLSNWLVEHVLHIDRQYEQCFHEHGL